ncbi:hypothetical protein LTSERUB_5318, partial [Salmonella enterica subsp. enterica serovar Rubislaw str. A4-653]
METLLHSGPNTLLAANTAAPTIGLTANAAATP